MKRTIIALFFLTFAVDAFPQFRVSEAEITVQSRHIWRGAKLGDAPAIEPSVTISGGYFSFNFWASKTTDRSYSEIDLIPSYQIGKLTFSLLDYYVPAIGKENQYLNFRKGGNRHTLEFSLDNYAAENGCLQGMIGIFLTGDRNIDTGNPFFSTYLELKYPFNVFRIDVEPFAGLTPFKGYYANQLAVVNSGLALSKAINLSARVSCPLNLAYTFNPHTNNHFVTFGFALKFRNASALNN